MEKLTERQKEILVYLNTKYPCSEWKTDLIIKFIKDTYEPISAKIGLSVIADITLLEEMKLIKKKK